MPSEFATNAFIFRENYKAFYEEKLKPISFHFAESFIYERSKFGMKNAKQLEKDFQRGVIKAIKKLLPGCIVMKTDPTYIQGFPDLLILYGKRWAALECKRNASASHRPNQDYYVTKLGNMSYAAFIYPENKESVLNAVREALQS